jgi:glutamyl-tRNA synthetase
VLLYEFFGWDMPTHGHLPLILNSDGKGKLSKRHGHASVNYYKEQGFLPEAVLNYLSNIVWHHPEEKEIYSLAEFIRLLDIKRVTSQGARFDLAKLEWMNGEHIRSKSAEELYLLVLPFIPHRTNKELVMKLLPLAKDRMKKLSEFNHYLKPFINYQLMQLDDTNRKLITDFIKLFASVTEWTTSQLEGRVKKYVLDNKTSVRDAFMALRLAVTGEKIGLPLFETLEILGKSEVLKRLEKPIT